jgi:hypothetical protein
MARKRRLGPAALLESGDLARIGLLLLEVLQERHAGDANLRGARTLVENFVKDLDALLTQKEE